MGLPQQSGANAALRISFFYAAFAGAWIWLSDSGLYWLFPDPASQTLLQSVKGSFFVIVTSLLLYLLIRRDATVREQLASRLKFEVERLTHIMDVNPAIIYSLTADSQPEGVFAVDYVSPNVQQITGYSPAQWMATPGFWLDRVHPDDRADALLAQQQLQKGGVVRYEYRFLRADGSYCWIYDQLVLTRNVSGRGAVAVGAWLDVTDRKQAEEQIHLLSNYDALTGLPNRALLQDRAQVALAAAQRVQAKVALLYVDLDRFKNINDSLGHAIGDRLLQELARRLTAHLHPDDTLCHQGGDEFILLLPDTDYQGAAHVAQRTLVSIAEPFTLDGQRLSLTASIGIALFPDNGGDLARLSQCADSALFRAKQNGRGNFQFFEQQMHERVNEVLRVENDLRRALENQELLLYYQAQVDAISLKIIGVEALVRWQHPEWGLVLPGRFIPIAEESGQIRDIGNWVLYCALQQNADWKAAGLPIVPVAINLSVVQFKDTSLCNTVVDALRVSGLDPAMVGLELTESIAMDDSSFTIEMVARLHALGIALSIDDFGTGYSSLSYLKRFKIDKLKIDQSFIRDLHRDPDDEAIVTAIIGLAKGLGFRTIAEGVETQGQLDFLRQHECDEIQGYFYSKPVPADEFARMLARGLERDPVPPASASGW